DISGARLCAASYRLSASSSGGNAGAYLNHRSANPSEANGLAYVSETSQTPFQSNLAHNFAIDDQDEVLTDMDFGDEPGSGQDGLDPNTDVILERIWITPTGTSGAGTLTVTLSDLSAATTQGDPNGAFFDSMTIASDEVSVTVTGPEYYWLETWTGGGGAILFDPEPNDANVPVFEANTVVELEADPLPGKYFDFWRLYDPNHPGDPCLYDEDTNNPMQVTMTCDMEVSAHSSCGGSGLGPMVMMTLTILSVCGMTRRARGR
ncbi:MAG: hypothetical protein JXQ75_06160, partial [Phycisphaerae bacterium]|nr:hypothetical protein [Phycisphaerae bacterium]